MFTLTARRRHALVAALIFVMVACVGAVRAADINVTTFTEDTGSGLTLRQAIRQANTQAGADTIHLQAGTYVLSIPGIEEDLSLTGDLDVTDTLTIQGVVSGGKPASIIDAQQFGDRVLEVRFSAFLVAQNVVLRGGGRDVTLAGGVLVGSSATLEMDNCVVRENSGPGLLDGGGIATFGVLFVNNSSITRNVAHSHGGGIYASDSSVNLYRSTIADNTVEGQGGGVYFNTPPPIPAPARLGPGRNLSVDTSTISGNHATSSGGGVYVNDGTASFFDTTIAANTAPSGAGVFLNNGDGFSDNFHLSNSLIADNEGRDCVTHLCTLLLDGPNFIEERGGECAVDTTTRLLTGMDPRLGPLKDNGGRTNTHMLLPGSPVIDQGSCNDSFTDAAEVQRYTVSSAGFQGYVGQDQRGLDREIFVPTTRERRTPDACDLGAVEYRKADLDALGGVQVPIRWCVLRGTSATDPNGDGPDDVALDRLGLANRILTSESDTTLYLRSAANKRVATVQIINRPSPDVRINPDPAAEDLSEFRELIRECRSRWSDLPGGITAVLIRRFIDGEGHVLPIAGIGGRAIEGDCAAQLSAGRLMVIDSGPVDGLSCNLEMTEERLGKFLAHELGHTFSLRHGEAIDSNFDHIIDEPDVNLDQIPDADPDVFPPNYLAGLNLMEYGELGGVPGTTVEAIQTFQAKEHALECVPGAEPLGVQPLTADLKTAVDADAADPGRIRIPSYGIVLNPNATSTLFAETASSPLTNNLASEATVPPPGTTSYRFRADLDHIPATGGTDPDDPSPNPTRGWELIGTVDVAAGVVAPPTVRTYLDGNWVNQEGATDRVRDLNIGIAQLCGNFTDLDPLVGASVQLTIPDHVLTEAGWVRGNQLDVQIVASETATHQENTVPPVGRTPLLADSDANLLPTCAVSPSSIAPMAEATISASDYVPNTLLDVRLGSEDLGTIPTVAPDGDGTLHARVPFGTPAGKKLVEVRDPQSALQAFCEFNVTDEPFGARCKDVTVSTDPGVCTAAHASIDDGSGDPNGGDVTLVQVPAGPYPLGATRVTLTATDGAGHSASCAAYVRVVDNEDPAITVGVTPQMLWPPNHRMVDVTATVRVQDNCAGGGTGYTLTSITINEAGAADDIQGAAYGTPDARFQLRAERNGNGSGRVYTIIYTATDATGHTKSGQAQVVVPHSQGHRAGRLVKRPRE